MTDIDQENAKDVSQSLAALRTALFNNGRWRQGIAAKKFPRSYHYFRIVDGDGDNL